MRIIKVKYPNCNRISKIDTNIKGNQCNYCGERPKVTETEAAYSKVRTFNIMCAIFSITSVILFIALAIYVMFTSL